MTTPPRPESGRWRSAARNEVGTSRVLGHYRKGARPRSPGNAGNHGRPHAYRTRRTARPRGRPERFGGLFESRTEFSVVDRANSAGHFLHGEDPPAWTSRKYRRPRRWFGRSGVLSQNPAILPYDNSHGFGHASGNGVHSGGNGQGRRLVNEEGGSIALKSDPSKRPNPAQQEQEPLRRATGGWGSNRATRARCRSLSRRIQPGAECRRPDRSRNCRKWEWDGLGESGHGPGHGPGRMEWAIEWAEDGAGLGKQNRS